MDRKRVGQRIKSWIADEGMSQEQVAKELGITTSALKSWVNGTRSFSFTQAEAIADFFGRSLDELACRDDREKKVA